MPDRRRRAALLLPQPVTTPGGVTPLGARTPAAGSLLAALGGRATAPWAGRPLSAGCPGATAGGRVSPLTMAAHEPGTGDGPPPTRDGAGGPGGREPGGSGGPDNDGGGRGDNGGRGNGAGDGGGEDTTPGPDEPSEAREPHHAGHGGDHAAYGHVESPEQREARHAGHEREHDNPFAPPPEGTPDQEWRPRHPRSHAHTHPTGQDGEDRGEGQDQGGDRGDHDRQPPPWGSQWSSRQPGRGPGAPGGLPGPDRRPDGPAGGLRWDPSDPAQRRARYALLAGMWAFFFVLFSLPEVALLLAALSLYWGISALRGRSGPARTTTAADLTGGPAQPGQARAAESPQAEGAGQPGGTPPGAPQGAARPQTTAAIGGLVTAGVALVLIAGSFTIRIVYKDYYGCVNDALTQSSRQSCEHLLPKELRPLLSTQR